MVRPDGVRGEEMDEDMIEGAAAHFADACGAAKVFGFGPAAAFLPPRSVLSFSRASGSAEETSGKTGPASRKESCMYWIISAVCLLLIAVLDWKTRFLMKYLPAVFLLVLSPHLSSLYGIANISPVVPDLPVKAFVSLLCLYFLIRFSFYLPKDSVGTAARFRIMMGGRRIFLVSLAAVFLQMPLVTLGWIFRNALQLGRRALIVDLVLTAVLTGFFLLNGAVRIFLTSRRLGIVFRFVILFGFWIPVVNIIIGLYACGIVKREYAHEVQKAALQSVRAESRLCATKYPLLLLHGVGFRDYKYINYWGRIPALLIKNGAVIDYGHQQAWASIESCAAEIKSRLLSFLEKTSGAKVNIIAHSKGGLDARYMISSLGMADKVASLTTISTPHRGSELMDVLTRMKESRYRKICDAVDKGFRRLGDENPDAYTASRQLQPSYLEEFNRKNPDVPGVYYQSYAAVMKNPASHTLLSFPSAIMQWKAGNNDGLVTIESAKWGAFRGTFKSAKRRGISHADQIDLMRKDYDGFDMAEEYVSIVAELKDMGY